MKIFNKLLFYSVNKKKTITSITVVMMLIFKLNYYFIFKIVKTRVQI